MSEDNRDNSILDVNISRRTLLKGVAAFVGGALVVKGAEVVVNRVSNDIESENNRTPTLEEAGIFSQVLEGVVNKEADPLFWERLNNFIRNPSKEDFGKYFSVNYGTTDLITENVASFNYFAEGDRNRFPDFIAAVTEPDGKKNISTRIDFQVNLKSHYSDKERIQRISLYVKEPEGLKELPWKEQGYSDNLEEGRKIERRRDFMDNATGFDYTEIVLPNRLLLIMSYPKTDTSTHFFHNIRKLKPST